jgi:hypothetical protein
LEHKNEENKGLIEEKASVSQLQAHLQSKIEQLQNHVLPMLEKGYALIQSCRGERQTHTHSH